MAQDNDEATYGSLSALKRLSAEKVVKVSPSLAGMAAVISSDGGIAAATAATIGIAATTSTTAILRVNSIRAALIANGTLV
jgi:hypothetical protein